jgi:hypothetical protein
MGKSFGTFFEHDSGVPKYDTARRNFGPPLLTRSTPHFSTAVNISTPLPSHAQDVVPHTCPACGIEPSHLPCLILLHELLPGCTNDTEPTC